MTGTSCWYRLILSASCGTHLFSIPPFFLLIIQPSDFLPFLCIELLKPPIPPIPVSYIPFLSPTLVDDFSYYSFLQDLHLDFSPNLSLCAVLICPSHDHSFPLHCPSSLHSASSSPSKLSSSFNSFHFYLKVNSEPSSKKVFKILHLPEDN